MPSPLMTHIFFAVFFAMFFYHSNFF